jgi:hypothetical protein
MPANMQKSRQLHSGVVDAEINDGQPSLESSETMSSFNQGDHGTTTGKQVYVAYITNALFAPIAHFSKYILNHV